MGRRRKVDIAMEATTPAEFARALGVNGLKVRNYLRSQGVYVSRGGQFDRSVKQMLIDLYQNKDSKLVGSSR